MASARQRKPPPAAVSPGQPPPHAPPTATADATPTEEEVEFEWERPKPSYAKVMLEWVGVTTCFCAPAAPARAHRLAPIDRLSARFCLIGLSPLHLWLCS